jgi:hypothetical protein
MKDEMPDVEEPKKHSESLMELDPDFAIAWDNKRLHT